MIPITRKELYLNKIVGNNEYETPEKPISEEEFFFAEILGEAVQAPEPLTRYQMYLAKIAGHNIEIPTPITRLEHFLARAAGMEIETPTPITREEMFWADYALIELNGIPPLTFTADGSVLKGYRIYGNTVNGENVGDLITEGEHAGEYSVPVTVEGKNLLRSVASSQTTDEGTTFTRNDDGSISVNADGTSSSICIYRMGCVLDAGDYILTGRPTDKSVKGVRQDIYWAGVDAMVESGFGLNFTIDADYTKVTVRIVVSKNTVVDNVTFYPMIRKADIEDSAYEPYHDPINTNLYLPEQIKMVGDEAEYISYTDHKLHRVGAEDIDVNLPELPTLAGTNTLTVGTEVQPSGIEIKGRIQEVTP